MNAIQPSLHPVSPSVQPAGSSVVEGNEIAGKQGTRGKIWIDLDNTPNVPFFTPIITELKRRNYAVIVTLRDCFQVRELADLNQMKYLLVGRHSGKNKIRKAAGLLYRALQLIPIILREKPDLALSVCSRAQLLACAVTRTPTVVMGDYEYSKGWSVVRPSYLLCPEVIPNSMIQLRPDQIWKYPGIKEDVYVPQFVPQPGIREQLGLREEDLLVTVRPPASEAHYHHPHSDELFNTAVEFLAGKPGVRLVALPRNKKQGDELRARWPEYFAGGKILIPECVVDGLNLIWHSDFVVSAGGTMNREAAALGVPVYSAFGGQIGAVDRYLMKQGRLVLLESVADIQEQIHVVRRSLPANVDERDARILRSLVGQIVAITNAQQRKMGRIAGRAVQRHV